VTSPEVVSLLRVLSSSAWCWRARGDGGSHAGLLEQGGRQCANLGVQFAFEFGGVLDALADKLPAVAEGLEATRADVLALTSFPKEVWRQIRSDDPIERLNREICRRTHARVPQLTRVLGHGRA
jgi:hypothetical protein